MRMQDKKPGAEVSRQVIGGWLFAILFLFVFISKARPYFNSMDPSLLVSSPVLGAN